MKVRQLTSRTCKVGHQPGEKAKMAGMVNLVQGCGFYIPKFIALSPEFLICSVLQGSTIFSVA